MASPSSGKEMGRRAYDGLLLDAANTLLQLNKPVEVTYASIGNKYGIERPIMNPNAGNEIQEKHLPLEEEYDQFKFLSLNCQERYYSDLTKKKLFPERGITLERVDESFSDFHRRLRTTRWIHFADEPCKANEQWVREFYANLIEVRFSSPVIRIRGESVDFGEATINKIYGLPDHDPTLFRAKDCAPGEWLVSKLCPGKKVPWATTKKNITAKEFTVEAKNWMSIICSQVSPCENVYEIPVLRAQMVACILDDIPVNVGHMIIRELKEYVAQNSSMLMFPSLITELCNLAGVEEDPTDNWVGPEKSIQPLKKRGEGGVSKGKKRKKGPESTSQVDPDSQPASGPFEELSAEIRQLREDIGRRSKGPGETSEGSSTFVSRKKFKKYLNNQKKQGSQMARLEKAYTDLAKTHGELNDSHTKMMKREKKRDKFFTRMWKGVKGLWKVLKPREPIPSVRSGDEDAFFHWSEDDIEDDDDESESDGSA